MEAFVVALQSVWNDSGFSAFTMGNAIMMLVGIILLYLAAVSDRIRLFAGKRS